MAPPRTFKTAFLADVILRYRGPVIATTTKADLFKLTSAVRSFLGPVHVFNPQHIGGVPSTFCWSPVDGCEDPATAIRRADAFAFAVSQKGVEDGTFWSAKASDYLRGYFYAAALARYDLRAVAAWVSGADPHIPEQILAAAGAHQWALTLAELRSEAHKTAATVRMVMSRSLAFMADPALAACVLPAPGTGFDIPQFLRDAGTVYMIAEAVSEEAPVAPLFAAMASEIHWIAAQMGQASPSGRLDPPLLMGLDEVTQICPVPLPSWLSDSGGKGIQVCAVVHGEAQLAERWGEHGRQVVLDTSSVKVFLPGITDVTTLQAASTLCGQASWKVRGQDHATRHDVATPDMIRQLPAGFALVIRGGCAPVIARLPRAWRNPAYRRARRLHAECPARAPARAPVVRTGHPPSRALPAPSSGTDHDQQRPDRRDPGPARRPPRAAHPAQPHPGRARRRPRRAHRHHHRRRRPRRLPPRTGAAVVEPPGRRTSRTHRPAARLGRAGLPARLRPPGRHPRPVLGDARPVPVRAGHRGQLVVGPVPAAAADPGPAVRPGRIPGPHPARPGRPAPGRNPALPSPPRPRTGQHPAVEQAMTGATLRQALAFATCGWPVLPCLPGQKIPATAHGYRDATTDPGQIDDWFGRHPDWNLAIATGAPGPDVLDVDDHGPAGNGYPAFRRLRAAGLLDGAAIYVRTPSGGLHAYFTGSRQRNGHLPGHHLDFRSAGGYVLTPPSQIDGQPYQLTGQPGGRGGLDWAAVTRLLQPQHQPSLPRPRQPQRRQPRPERPGPLGRRPDRRQPQRRPVLGRQPRPGR